MPNKNNHIETLALASLTFLIIIFAQTPGQTTGLHNSTLTGDNKIIIQPHYSAPQSFHP